MVNDKEVCNMFSIYRRQNLGRSKSQCHSQREYLKDRLSNDAGDGFAKWTHANLWYEKLHLKLHLILI